MRRRPIVRQAHYGPEQMKCAEGPPANRIKVQDVNLKEQIVLLKDLQALDFQLYTLSQEEQNIPLNIKELDESFAKKKENLSELEKKGLELQKKRKEQELELAAKEEAGRKMQNQLYQLKTNKEYTAKLKEIEGAKADASAIEDKILALFEEADKFRAGIEKEKSSLAAEAKNVDAQKQKLAFRGKEIKEKIHQLQAERDRLGQQINPKIIGKYEKILKNRDYQALVKVEDYACQGCFMKVSPQVINLIKMYDDLVVCEVCQRILYIDDETSVF